MGSPDLPGTLLSVPDWRLRDQLLAALTLGAAGGLLESASHLVYHRFFGARIPLGAYLLWMPAAADAALLAVVALLLWGLHRAWPRGVTPARMVGVLVALAALAPLLRFDRVLGLVTVDLLAAGIGVQAAQRLGPRLAGLRRAAATAGPALLLLVVLLAVGVEWRYRRLERSAMAALPAPVAGARNVLLLVLDTVRSMNLSLYGYDRATTPVLDSLAQHGAVRFDRAYATAPWTLPSHASIMTGHWEHELSADWQVPLDDADSTLAEVLDRAGYRTGGFVANLAYLGRNMGIDRGFARYVGHQAGVIQVLRSAAMTTWVTNWPGMARILPPMREDYRRKTVREVNALFLDWLDATPGRPFFAFLNYFDAHHGYLPAAPFDTSFSSPAYPPPPVPRHGGTDPKENPRPMREYDQAIATIDHEIGQLLAALRARGELEQTVVIVTADHGEEFGEHGMYGHGHTLYTPGLQVPLVVLGPGLDSAPPEVPAAVSLRDLPATVLELALRRGPAPFPGHSLARYWEGAAPIGPDSLLVGSRYAANRADWYPTSKGDLNGAVAGADLYVREADGHEELFDVLSDPWQGSNLAGSAGRDSALQAFRGLLERTVGPPVPVRR